MELARGPPGQDLLLPAPAELLRRSTGQPHTAHTTDPVPVIITKKGVKLRNGGVLADVAPTVLDLMGLPIPTEMTGKSLIVNESAK